MNLKDDTLVIVLAHGRAADVVQRHLPIWRDHGNLVVFFTPVDDPLPDFPGLIQFSRGKSKAYSADTNLRCREALRFAAMCSKFSFTLLFEYDSLVFNAIPAEHSPTVVGVDVVAPVFHNADPKFQGKAYLHFPQFYSAEAVNKVVDAMDAMVLDAEHGFTDRYIGLAVEKAGLHVRDLNPTGFVYTQNEIDTAKLPEALAAYAKGARWSHGIKTAEVFQALRKASFE